MPTLRSPPPLPSPGRPSMSPRQHIAVTIGEEVDLQTRLLTDLDEDVDVTQARLRAATKRIRHIIKHSSNWKCGVLIFLLIVVLTVVIVIGFKLLKLFA